MAKQIAKTGADVVVETLEARGTTHVFGVSGAKIDRILDRLLDSTIQTVVCRHEQNAAFADEIHLQSRAHPPPYDRRMRPGR